MLLRRINEHVRAHNWFAVFIDFAIVVVGVFVGMQVTDWNNARIARQAGDAYRVRIVQEMRLNATVMERRVDYYGRVRAHAVAALDAIEGRSRLSDEDFLVAAYHATQRLPRALSRGAYDEAVEVGAFADVGSADVRTVINGYYAHIDVAEATFAVVPPYRDIVRRNMPLFAQEQIISECGETRRPDGAGAYITELPEHCDLGLTPQQAALAVRQLRSTPELARDLTRHIADLDLKLDLMRSALGGTPGFIEQIEAPTS